MLLTKGEASGLPTYLALAGLGPSRHALGYCLSSLPQCCFPASNSDICYPLLPLDFFHPLGFLFLSTFPQCSFLQCHQTMVNNTGVGEDCGETGPSGWTDSVPSIGPSTPASKLWASGCVDSIGPTLLPGRLPTPSLGTARPPYPHPPREATSLKLVHSPSL